MLIVLANVAYGLMLCAFVMRDMLRLRTLLLVAQTLVVIYAWQAGVPVISAWNIVYVSINAFMVVQILRERRAVVLPAELVPLYDRHFAALSPPEFLRWWRQGRTETLEGASLARVGVRPDALYFILAGTVRVSRGAQTVAEVPAGFFIAEMSLLTGCPANADVDTVGRVDVIRWATGDLDALRGRNPALWTKIQSVIGLDLVAKVRREELVERA